MSKKRKRTKTRRPSASGKRPGSPRLSSDRLVGFEKAIDAGASAVEEYVSHHATSLASSENMLEAIFITRRALYVTSRAEVVSELLADLLFQEGERRQGQHDLINARYLFAEAISHKDEPSKAWVQALRETAPGPLHEPALELLGVPSHPETKAFIELLLLFFQEIEAPLRIFWASGQEGDLPGEKVPPIAHSVPTIEDGIIIAHNIVLNASHYEKATIIEIMGDMAHELAHEAWKALGADSGRFVPHFTANETALAANEWITDFNVILRGLGSWLLRSREYAEDTQQIRFDERYVAMKPTEIRRRLRVELEQRGQKLINDGAELTRLGSAVEAEASFAEAKRIWLYVTEEDPGYAFGHYELAATEGWLRNWDKAIESGREAVRGEPRSRAFTKYLQEILDTYPPIKKRVAEGNRLMKTAVLSSDARPAHRRDLFTRALKIWGKILDDTPYFAFAHHEYGVAASWIGEWTLAVEHLEKAIELRPTATEYARSLANVHELSSQGERAGQPPGSADGS